VLVGIDAVNVMAAYQPVVCTDTLLRNLQKYSDCIFASLLFLILYCALLLCLLEGLPLFHE
jgi:hypothetical protein